MRNRDEPAALGDAMIGVNNRDEVYERFSGLTKREAAAMHNMASLLSEQAYSVIPDHERQRMAQEAVKSADALFDALEGIAPPAQAENETKG